MHLDGVRIKQHMTRKTGGVKGKNVQMVHRSNKRSLPIRPRKHIQQGVCIHRAVIKQIVRQQKITFYLIRKTINLCNFCIVFTVGW